VPAAIVTAAALLAGGYVAGQAFDEDSAITTVPSSVDTGTAQPTEALATADGAEPVAAVAAAISPAVVQLEVGQGLGSGVIYDAQGLIMTAAHVIEGADQLTVRLSDGRELPGEVVGLNTETDIGVVSFDPPEGTAVAPLAAEPPAVGELAVAVGSPFALEQTVTSGIVSAYDRAVPGGSAVGVVQTDAAINPGNSGGPLVNRAGEVIGINSFIQSEGGGSVGLGFAIPIDTGIRVADKLVAGEPVELGYLGVSTGESTDGRVGALVADVEAGLAAAEAGIRQGDVITAVDGSPVVGSAELGAAIKDHDAGDVVELTVVRDGTEQQISATLDALG
jgi:S1-C subfamily serine protease